MDEREPTVKFFLSGEMDRKDFADLITAVGSRMLDGVRLGQGELDFTADMDRQELLNEVTLQSARNFYLRLFQDDKPSPIATVVVHEIAGLLPEKELIRSKKGELTGIFRNSWDLKVESILRGDSTLAYRPGTKRRAFLESFQSYLPRQENKKEKRQK